MKKFWLCVLILLCGVQAVLSQNAVFPLPSCMVEETGKIVIGKGWAFKGEGEYAARMADELRQSLYAASFPVDTSSAKGMVEIRLDAACGLEKDAYNLSVETSRVLLEASSESGLFYAKETFLQMCFWGNGKMRACRIQDNPRYGWRGFMLDESRHFFGKEKVKQYLDMMAVLKLNVFHWHLTDETGWRIEIRRYPKLTAEGAVGNWHDAKAPAAYYTQQDIKEIVSYATARHIMVVPEFDMPGHATAVCRAYPEISGGGEGRWEHFTFHPCKEATFQFISNVLDELIELFPSPYIHLGGDEVHFGNQSWFTDPDIQRFIKEKNLVNEVGLEHYFIRRVVDIVASKGKIAIGWDEIVDAGVSPSKAVVMWWRHDRKYQLLKALENGYKVVMTPRRPFYGDFVQYSTHQVGRRWDGYNTIEQVYNYPDPVEHLMKGYEQQVLGIQFSMWTERIADSRRLDFMTFPRLIAFSEAAWTPGVKKECTSFLERLPVFLQWLDKKGIYYFNIFNPSATPEPSAPDKEDVLKNG